MAYQPAFWTGRTALTWQPTSHSRFLFEKPDDESETQGNVAIWILNRDEVQQKAPEGQLQIVSVQDHENNRLGNQFGVFTYLKTNESSLEEYLISPAIALSGAIDGR